jgi:hypothetical protein
MTLFTSIAVVLAVLAAIGLLAFVCFAPRRTRSRRKAESLAPQSLAPLADPPTITHYGHA